ncbi:unnamed protein product [Sphenostylis stenocarpa]|uniref:Uncharacterized protein n=1 Tax=Sphenostylis stenocarpa TaxID=92480 RepID=A0AA86TGI4_9FABA|nr:unnamed protein product [Sphenostylis stenocarpa]
MDSYSDLRFVLADRLIEAFHFGFGASDVSYLSHEGNKQKTMPDARRAIKHLTYADFGRLCSTPVNSCGSDVPRGQRQIHSRSVGPTPFKGGWPALPRTVMFDWAYTHSLTYVVPPQLTLAQAFCSSNVQGQSRWRLGVSKASWTQFLGLLRTDSLVSQGLTGDTTN